MNEVAVKHPGFRPSCMCLNDEKDDDGSSVMRAMCVTEDWEILNHPDNPIHMGRFRLLCLEEGIERRYLKPPLGQAGDFPFFFFFFASIIVCELCLSCLMMLDVMTFCGVYSWSTQSRR